MRFLKYIIAIGCVIVLTASSVVLLSKDLVGCSPGSQMFSEDIAEADSATLSPLSQDPRITIEPLPEGGKDIIVSYKGSEFGSERIVKNLPLLRSIASAELTYTVKFMNDFEFVKGGKLPGLGPDHHVAGGKPSQPSGWSVRPVFRGNGTIALYIYHQDMNGKYGKPGILQPKLKMRVDAENKIRLYVKLNSDSQTSDGEVRLWLNGSIQDEITGIRLFSSQEPALISRVLFHTFFGGNTPAHAPRDLKGYKTVHARFDHLLVCSR